jgi:hypothetical protein
MSWHRPGGKLRQLFEQSELQMSYAEKEFSVFKNKALIPKVFMQFWDFILGNNKTPGCVITCQANNTKIF